MLNTQVPANDTSAGEKNLSKLPADAALEIDFCLWNESSNTPAAEQSLHTSSVLVSQVFGDSVSGLKWRMSSVQIVIFKSV